MKKLIELKVIVLSIFVLFNANMLYAQFSGGFGDGASLLKTCDLKPSGVKVTQSPKGLVAIPDVLSCKLFWSNSVTEANKYLVYISTNRTNLSTTSPIVTNSNELVINNLSATNYYVSIRAITTCDTTNFSNIIEVIPFSNIHSGGNGDGFSSLKSCRIKPSGISVSTGPKSLQATPSFQSTTLNWSTDVPEVIDYLIYQSTNPSTILSSQPLLTSNNNELKVDNLTPNSTYYYAIRAVTFCDTTNISPIVSTIPFANIYAGGNGDGYDIAKTCLVQPSGTLRKKAPAAITAIPNVNSVSLRWTSDIPEVESYKIIYSTNANLTSASTINNISANEYTINNLTANTTYYFGVVAKTKCFDTDTSTIVSTIPFSGIYAGGSGDGFDIAKTCLVQPSGTLRKKAPAAITAIPNVNSVSLRWTSDIPEVESYKIIYSTNANLTSASTINDISANEYTINNLTANTTYYFGVVAKTKCFDTDTSTIVSTIPFSGIYAGGNGDGFDIAKTCLVQPSGTLRKKAPAAITAIPNVNSVSLRWTSDIPEVESYKIIYSTNANLTSASTINNISANEYTINNLTANTTYYFGVEAITKCFDTDTSTIVSSIPFSGIYSGGNGDGFSFVASCLGKINGALNNNGPNSVTAIPNANSIQVSWSQVSGALSYVLYYDTIANVANRKTSNRVLNISSTSYTILNTLNKTYYIAIKAVSSCDTSNASNEAISIPLGLIYNGGNGDGHSLINSCLIKPNGTSVKNPPTNFRLLPLESSIELSWDNTIPNVKNYLLYVSTSPNALVNGSLVSLSTSTYVLNNINSNTKYYFRIRAVTNCDTTNPSTEISGVALGRIYQGGNGDGFDNIESCLIKPNGNIVKTAPSNVSLLPSETSIKMTWGNTIPNVLNYLVYVSTSPGAVANGTLYQTTTNDFTLNNASSTTKYYFAVKAITSCDTTNASIEVSGIALGRIYQGGIGDGFNSLNSCLIKPNGIASNLLPRIRRISPGPDEITVYWSKNFPDAENYSIFFGNQPNVFNTGQKIDNLTDSFVKINTSTLNGTYVYVGLSVKSYCGTIRNSLVDSASPFRGITKGGGADGHASDSFNSRNLCGLGFQAQIQVQGPTLFCAGNTVDLVAGAGNFRYKWLKNGVIIPNATNGTYTVDTTGTYRVIVYGGSCRDTSSSVTLIRKPGPNLSITASSTTNFCNGDSVVLVPSNTNGLLYTWVKNLIDTVQSSTKQNFTAKETGTYKLYMTDTSCVKPSNTISIVVDTLSKYKIGIVGKKDICLGDSTLLFVPNQPNFNYQWYFNGQSVNNRTSSIYASQTGNYFVRYTNSTCTKYSDTISMIVNNKPSDTIKVSRNPQICKGDSVSLTLDIKSGYTYQWLRNNQNLPTNTPSTIWVKNPGTYHAIIINGGCIVTTQKVSVIVDSSLPAASAYALTDTIICKGSYTTMGATNNPQFNYQWLKDGVLINGANQNVYTAFDAGLYELLIQKGGCELKFRVARVVVDSLGGLQINNGQNLSLCEGDSVKLEIKKVQGVNYAWFKDNQAIALPTTTQNFIYVKEAAEYSAVASSIKCVLPLSSVKVSILPSPSDTIILSRNLLGCVGDTVEFITQSFPTHTYKWFFNGVVINGETKNSYKATVNGNYYAEITNVGGCTKRTKTQTLQLRPKPDVFINGNSVISACSGDSITLNTNFSTGDKVQWYRNGQILSGENKRTYQPFQSGAYTVSIENEFGCSATSPAVDVTITPNPKVSLAVPSTNNLCYGDSFLMSALVDSGVNLQWYRNNQQINGATKSSLVAKNPGFYYLEAKSNSCTSKTKTVLVNIKNQLPEPIIQRFSDTLKCLNAGFSYQWYLNNALIPNAIQNFLVVNTKGNYLVEISDTSNCSRISNSYYYNPLVVENMVKKDKLKIYPNPTNGNLFIEATDNSMTMQCHILNLQGKQIANFKLGKGEGNVFVYDTKLLAAGVYLLKIESDRFTDIVKFEVVK
jgi:hypothetical protein